MEFHFQTTDPELGTRDLYTMDGIAEQIFGQDKTVGFEHVWAGHLPGLQNFVHRWTGEGRTLAELRDPVGATLLHVAMLRRQPVLARFLVESDPTLVFEPFALPDNRVSPYDGETVMHIAVTQGDVGMVEYLFESALKYRLKLLQLRSIETGVEFKEARALEFERPRLVKDLIDRPLAFGSEFRFDTHGSFNYGGTVLAFAALAQNKEMVEYLVEKLGCDVTVTDNVHRERDVEQGKGITGFTVLHTLAFHGKFRYKGKEDTTASMFRYLCDQAKKQLSSVVRMSSKHPLAPWWLRERSRIAKQYTDPKQKEIVIQRFIDLMTWKAYVKTDVGLEAMTPLEVAIWQRKTAILDEIKRPIWEFGQTRCYQFPLNHLYSANGGGRKGSSRPRTAFHIAVDNGDFATVSHPIFQMIIQCAWETPGPRSLSHRQLVYLRFSIAFILMVLFAVTVSLMPVGNRGLYSEPRGGYRMALEIIVILLTLTIATSEVRDIWNSGLEYIRGIDRGITGAANVFRLLFIGLMIAVVVNRCAFGNFALENALLGLAAILGWIYLFFFAKHSSKLGPFVIVFLRIVYTDLVQFLVLYMFFNVGFACAFFLQLSPVASTSDPSTSFSDWQWLGGAVVWMFRYLYGGAIYDDFRKAVIPDFSMTLFIVINFITNILLINVFIAQLSRTVAVTYEKARAIWILQWAESVLSMNLRNPGSSMELGFVYQKSRLDLRALYERWAAGSDDEGEGLHSPGVHGMPSQAVLAEEASVVGYRWFLVIEQEVDGKWIPRKFCYTGSKERPSREDWRPAKIKFDATEEAFPSTTFAGYFIQKLAAVFTLPLGLLFKSVLRRIGSGHKYSMSRTKRDSGVPEHSSHQPLPSTQ
ncbi:uncharacterized protein BJ171DRAFT_488875 [Polychytrium aggregatum]|uniref:uncharacterized protein n=1 Tax=Polychytrium aggregatum TaxID=110093 RepID=UPI0022FDEF74|nr:uncharacterized protein BJ171DRAFT_488875 [Polychytrium aggregatum]KAI9208424.1 hypothetical protein BJ171DRAFT_488875 [Polychytrium aggregatum]